MQGTGDVVGRLMSENDELRAERDALAAEVRRLRAVEGRAREIYADPAGHGVEAWRAARNILGDV